MSSTICVHEKVCPALCAEWLAEAWSGGSELLEENGVGCGEERELGPSFFPGRRRMTAGAKGGCNNESKSYTKRTVWGHFLILKKM